MPVKNFAYFNLATKKDMYIMALMEYYTYIYLYGMAHLYWQICRLYGILILKGIHISP